MPENKKIQQLVSEIKIYMKYAVTDDQLETAGAVVEKYRNTPRILNLLREFYVALPDAREEPVLRIALLFQHQGVYLLVVTTPSVSHLYISSAQEVVWLGEYKDEVESEILSYFGFDSQEEFLKNCPPVAELEEYRSNRNAEISICPACGVQEGEIHLLGCSVEVCPWCDGHLSKCNCRFEQLEVDTIDTDEQLEDFVELLTRKGRIPYDKPQAPYYPGTSDGLDGDGNDTVD